MILYYFLTKDNMAWKDFKSSLSQMFNAQKSERNGSLVIVPVYQRMDVGSNGGRHTYLTQNNSKLKKVRY